MSPPSEVPLGQRVPDVPHAVSVHLPKWQDMLDFATGENRVRSVQEGGYPRSFLHKDVQRVHDTVARKFATSNHASLVFPSIEYAIACKTYVCKPDDGLDPTDIIVRSIELDFKAGLGSEETAYTPIRLHVVSLPRKEISRGMVFWRLTGCGISSRLAEDILKTIDTAHEVEADPDSVAALPHSSTTDSANLAVRRRVAEFLERAPTGGPRSPKVTADDVFLYPSGMAAIHHLTQSLREWPGVKSVVFGFPYELTLKMQEDFAKGCLFYGFGTHEESELLEDYLHMLAQNDQCIQAVWCECASNPLLRTVGLDRLRRLADRYGFLIIVDDTIGSSANIDVLGVADIVVTSLTKSFSGYADVMAGSVALNPRSVYYERMRKAVAGSYTNLLYGKDAIKLEMNSRGYLPRVAKMNDNAASLVALLQPFASNPECPLQRVYYPSTCEWSSKNYKARMRPATAEFVPGHGGVFTLEFDNVKSSAKFFDDLQVCKGPSLGAEVTLAQPYVQTVFKDKKSWAARYGISETIVRISVGVEDREVLKSAFLKAIDSLTQYGSVLA